MHGWLDNCGSFDPLILNHFEGNHRLIAIDVPGHGFSSPYQPGLTYHHMEGIQYIRRVADYYGLDRFNLLGHSMGASMSFLYAAVYPEHVRRLVMLDSIKPISRRPPVAVEASREHFDSVFQLENKPEKVYPTYEVAYELQRRGSETLIGGKMTKEALDALAARSIKKVPQGYAFTRDIRHRIRAMYLLETEVIKEYAKAVRCPHLVVKSTPRKHFEDPQLFDEIKAVFEASNPDGFVLEEVDGHHQVHMTHPEKVWPIIAKFLEKTASVS